MTRIWCDGSSTNDRGPRSLAKWAIKSTEPAVGLDSNNMREWTGPGTSNEAEWKGMICALHHVAQHSPGDTTIYTDSELVYHQLVTRNYQVRNSRLKVLYGIGITILNYIHLRPTDFTIEVIPREENRAHMSVRRNEDPDPLWGVDWMMMDITRYGQELETYDTLVDEMAEEARYNRSHLEG